jgi:hypothetical protein
MPSSINFDWTFLNPQQKKMRQLQLESAQADLDQKKSQIALQNHIAEMFGGGQGGVPSGPAPTAGVGGVTQASQKPMIPPQTAGMPQNGGATALMAPPAQGGPSPNGAGPLTGQDPRQALLLRAVLAGVISPAAFKLMTGSATSKPVKPTQMSGPPGPLGQTTKPQAGQPSFTLPDPVAFAANARANIWSQTFDKQHSQDMMKIQGAHTEKIGALDLLAKQLQVLNQAKDFKSSSSALAQANTFYQQALKSKLTGLQDTGVSGVLDSFFDKPTVDKKALQQVASAIAKAKLAQEKARDKQIDDLNRNYTDQKVKFFAQPMSAPSEAPDPSVAEASSDGD